ncbi:MAG: S1 family peptidase [Deltaproteobacteria bacterium]|nr:S1 family peptidase [Deltaproteobacteria bacterium]
MLRCLIISFITVLFFTGIISGCEDSPSADLLYSPSKILGGDIENDFTAVGGLQKNKTLTPFCTGELIDKSYVLTAAHCVMDKLPGQFQFFLQTYEGDKSVLDYFDVKEIFIHPDFILDAYLNDIAILKIEGDTSKITPINLNKSSIDNLPGQRAKYVGYGQDDNHYSGVRRSADIIIDNTGRLVISSSWDASEMKGICFGDSGGAVISVSDEGLSLIAVISNIVSYAGEDMDNKCIGNYLSTRVDKYVQWILAVTDSGTGGGNASCIENSNLCLCDDACSGTGSCDNNICKTSTCENGYDCVISCGSSDSVCINNCYSTMAFDEAVLLLDFVNCGVQYCSQSSGEEIFDCIFNNCNSLFLNCFNSQECRPGKEDCNGGLACYSGRFGLTYCGESLNIADGDTCDEKSDKLQCLDGSACVFNSEYGSYSCEKVCLSDSDCLSDQLCNGEGPTIGYSDDYRSCKEVTAEVIASCSFVLMDTKSYIRSLFKILFA